ncbi:putative 1-beta dynein [Operophtera brumata]|uniref:Putative 1-beta dynein n=1 Tax=Operophtera brumata TaxID=104452 RepID=A0A0L7LHE5_OPEBR|nr:putative 1-beta dynein [Operophtera brumata]
MALKALRPPMESSFLQIRLILMLSKRYHAQLVLIGSRSLLRNMRVWSQYKFSSVLAFLALGLAPKTDKNQRTRREPAKIINILELCKEASHWEGLGMEIPIHAYHACEKKVQPGILKLTWTSTMSDAYIADCVTQIGELQDFLTTYKNCNLNLVKIMEKICDTPLVEFDIYNAFEISVLRENIRRMQAEAAATILEMYKEIITYLMAEYWVKYVRRFDRLLEDALRLAVKATLQNLYKCERWHHHHL